MRSNGEVNGWHDRVRPDAQEENPCEMSQMWQARISYQEGLLRSLWVRKKSQDQAELVEEEEHLQVC